MSKQNFLGSCIKYNVPVVAPCKFCDCEIRDLATQKLIEDMERSFEEEQQQRPATVWFTDGEMKFVIFLLGLSIGTALGYLIKTIV